MYTLGRSGDASPIPVAPVYSGGAPTMLPGGPPWAGGQFQCSGSFCVPADGRAFATVQAVNRFLGIKGRTGREGFDFGTLQAVNALVLGGQIHVRPFHSTHDLAARSLDVLRALMTRPGPTLGESRNMQRSSVAAPVPKKKPKIEVRQVELIKQLQRALRAAGAKDERGRLPTVDGVLGPITMGALNNLQASYGRLPLTKGQVLTNLEEVVKTVGQKAVATAAKTSLPTTVSKAAVKPTIHRMPEEVIVAPGARQVGMFSCKKGVCTPVNGDAQKKAAQFQQLLNAFPSQVVARFPKAQPLKADGKIGPATVAAARAVTAAAALRQNQPVDARALDAVTAEVIAGNFDAASAKFGVELPLQQKFYAQAALPPSVSGLSFKLTKAGVAVGDPTFRCYAMALQTQLNRLGQRLVVDGALGKNTVASVNKVLGGARTTADVATQLPVVVAQAREAADKGGAPPPPAKAMAVALRKCRIESKQPLVDRRFFQSGGQIVATAQPTPAPTPQPTAAQPLPPSPKLYNVAPERIAELKAQAIQNGLTEGEANAVAEIALANNATDDQLVAALQNAIDDKWRRAHAGPAPQTPANVERVAGRVPPGSVRRRVVEAPTAPAPSGDEGGGGEDLAPEPSPAPSPAPTPSPSPQAPPGAPVSDEEAAQLVANAVAAGLSQEEAASIVAAGRQAGASLEDLHKMLQTAIAAKGGVEEEEAAAPEPGEPTTSEGLSTGWKVGLGVAAGAAAIGGGVALYKLGQKRRRR